MFTFCQPCGSRTQGLPHSWTRIQIQRYQLMFIFQNTPQLPANTKLRSTMKQPTCPVITKSSSTQYATSLPCSPSFVESSASFHLTPPRPLLHSHLTWQHFPHSRMLTHFQHHTQSQHTLEENLSFETCKVCPKSAHCPT